MRHGVDLFRLPSLPAPLLSPPSPVQYLPTHPHSTRQRKLLLFWIPLNLILNISSSSLVVPAATGAGYDPAATSTVSVKPVGAANAGTDPFSNAAAIPRQISLPAVALTAIVGAVVLLL